VRAPADLAARDAQLEAIARWGSRLFADHVHAVLSGG
jgi:hypothetical protein